MILILYGHDVESQPCTKPRDSIGCRAETFHPYPPFRPNDRLQQLREVWPILSNQCGESSGEFRLCRSFPGSNQFITRPFSTVHSAISCCRSMMRFLYCGRRARESRPGALRTRSKNEIALTTARVACAKCVPSACRRCFNTVHRCASIQCRLFPTPLSRSYHNVSTTFQRQGLACQAWLS